MSWKLPGELQKTLEPGSSAQWFWFTWCGAWPGLQDLLSVSGWFWCMNKFENAATKDLSEQTASFPFLKGTFPGHGRESSPCWGPSRLSTFCPALCYRSYINGPETIWVVSSKSSDQISDCSSLWASITPPPFLSISGSAWTLPLTVSQNQNTSISGHRRASMGRTLTLYSMISVKWENMFQPLIFRKKPKFRW